jgi:signal peptide peptidase-like 3
MLLALVLFFDNRKQKDVNVPSDMPPSKRRNYVWYALIGYGVGLVAALAAGILSQSPQPALWSTELRGRCCWPYSQVSVSD